VKPYYQDDAVTIYHGDFRSLASTLPKADVIIADPPYAETNLAWDRWPEGWTIDAAGVSRSMWCFGSMRMFLDRGHTFCAGDWVFAQDIIWEKHNGSGSSADRFRRVHEICCQFYLGEWSSLYHQPVMTQDATARTVRRKPAQSGQAEVKYYRI